LNVSAPVPAWVNPPAPEMAVEKVRLSLRLKASVAPAATVTS
jgi:hypothetical protein